MQPTCQTHKDRPRLLIISSLYKDCASGNPQSRTWRRGHKCLLGRNYVCPSFGITPAPRQFGESGRHLVVPWLRSLRPAERLRAVRWDIAWDWTYNWQVIGAAERSSAGAFDTRDGSKPILSQFVAQHSQLAGIHSRASNTRALLLGYHGARKGSYKWQAARRSALEIRGRASCRVRSTSG